MQVPTFLLERNQTLFENTVDINLTESGVHAATVGDLVPETERDALAGIALGYGYTEGTPALRQAIADWHPGAGADNVFVGTGTSEANLIAMMTLASKGEHIVVVTPNFMQIDGMARALSVEVTQVALKAEDDWQPDAATVTKAIRPGKTAFVTLCDPNNPTGVAMRADRRRALSEATERAGVWLLVDEIYRGSEIDGGPDATSWGLGDKVMVTGGLSKSFGCPGLRIGWCLAPPQIVAEMHRRQDYTTIGTGPLAQDLAHRALQEPLRSQLLHRGQAILAQGRKRVADWVANNEGWNWVKPDASGQAFIAYPMPVRSSELVEALRKETGVFVCAGDWFGIDGHVRLGFGVDASELEEGLRRFDRFLMDHYGAA
ncbi:aminotransferase class I/II-fold pyridoxal phosphate-dependent enzyme [Ahrensia marina]|uniref:aminotransferase class I/II-fold pyridoxal phosphate-dependent enzyme n=1 Tax=Ahrensia marina TaxID=1514904 RepID=UPI0035CEDFA4